MTQKILLKNPYCLIAFGFGTGLLPFMPGTFGTLLAIPFYLVLAQFSCKLYFLFSMISFLIGIWICRVAEIMVGIEDFSGIVWDEMVGFWVTMFMVPISTFSIVCGFLIFRAFDVLKPWPISFLNHRVHGGLGIMLDDLVAGIASCICLHILYLRAL